MFLELCVLGGKRMAVKSPFSCCPWLHPRGLASCLSVSLSVSGSSEQGLPVFPVRTALCLFLAIQPRHSHPHCWFQWAMFIWVLFPNFPVGTAGTEGSQMIQLNLGLLVFLLLIKGKAKEVWLLTWKGCNSHLTLLPATCLSDRR